MSTSSETLWDRLASALAARADAPALTFLDAELTATTFSGRTLLARVEELATRLDGVPRGSGPLGILSASQETQVLHFLAALSRGQLPAILTPHNRKLQLAHYAEMLAAVTERCGFSAVITDLPALTLPVPILQAESLQPRNESAKAPAAASAGVPFVQFSSGTTGIKRGVVVSDRAVLAQIDAYAAAIELEPSDVVVSWLPLYHDMGFVACFLMPLACGVPSVMLNPLDWVAKPAHYLHAVTRYRGTLSWHPNFAFAFLAERVAEAECTGLDLSSLRGLVNCSEPTTHASQARFSERFARHGLSADVFRGCYAMAETTFALTDGRCTDPSYFDAEGPMGGAPVQLPAISAGRPLPGVELEIVDEQGRLLAEREIGEIRVRCPFQFDGYYQNAEATEAALGPHGYRTGDLGYRVGDELFVSGRKKDVLIVGGVNVWPQDLESLAGDVPGVRAGRAVAFSEFDAARQTEKVVLLAETELPLERQRAVVLAIRQRIASALQLANFDVFLLPPGWLAKSSSGKMARSQNRARWLAGERA